MPKIIKRRRFLHDSALIAAVIALFSLLLAAIKTLVPAFSREKRTHKIGKRADMPINSFHLVQGAQIFVYRDHEGVRAVSAVCTHLGCLLEKDENGFHCPCHGSRFDVDGKVKSGPALRSLAWYKINPAIDGGLTVDIATRVSPDEKFII